MCNPDEPYEILVMELDDICDEHNFLVGKIYGTDRTLSLSGYAIKQIVTQAIRSRFIIGTGSISFYKVGDKRSTLSAKNKKTAT